MSPPPSGRFHLKRKRKNEKKKIKYVYFCFLGYVFLCTCFVCMDLFRGYIVYYPKKASMDPTSAEFKQDLRQRLTPLQWSVTQEKGTERWVVFCLLTMFIKSYSFFVVARRLFSFLFHSLSFLNFVTVRNRVYKCTRLSNSFPSYTRCETWI